MELKQLGNTGVMVPEIGIGTWQYRGGVEPIRRGLKEGAFLIDTAEIYGTEPVVGEAIKGMPRDQVFIATKVSGDHLRPNEVLRAADASLKRLGIDHIDLYQIHWPNPNVPIEETMGAMESLVDRGKVRFIGVSNFYFREFREAQRAMRKHRIQSNQMLYSLMEREIEEDLLALCQEQKVTVLAFSPLARGALLAKPLLGMRGRAFETVQRIAREVGKTPAQVVLNWCICRPWVIAIPKSNRAERVEENCRASGWCLSDEQIKALDNAFR